jgi:hypothetical protein
MLEFEGGLVSADSSNLEIAKIEGLILSHQVDKAELSDVRRTVAWGINLRERFGSEITLETARELIEYICHPLYFASKYLDQPIPDGVGFIEGKRGIPDLNINDGIYIMAENWRSPKFPDILINYSPYYLKLIAELIDGSVGGEPNRAAAIYSLAETSGHEASHTRQRQYSPYELYRDVAILKEEGPRAWNDTPSERAARRFGDRFAIAYVSALMQMPQIRPQIVGY